MLLDTLRVAYANVGALLREHLYKQRQMRSLHFDREGEAESCRQVFVCNVCLMQEPLHCSDALASKVAEAVSLSGSAYEP